MMHSLVNMFAQAGVSQASVNTLRAEVRVRTLDAGTFVFHQGDPAPDVYLLRRGLAKLFYLTPDGKEFVKSFIAEGQVMGSLAAQLGDQGATFSIVCLEPCEMDVVGYRTVDALCACDPVMQKVIGELFRDLALKKELREYEFLCLPPEERYRVFTEKNPGLAARVTQADIARYLGITPVALSRIRGRLRDT